MALAILLGAPAASAKTITIGSPMTTSFTPTAFGPEVTVAHAGLPEDGANVTAPVNGTIVSWKVLGAVGGPLTLRVIHPTSDTFFIGTGTTTSGPITGTGLLTFNANLQIKAGDRIGIQPTTRGDLLGFNGGISGAAYSFWQPFLGDASNSEPRSPSVASANGEWAFNAQISTNCIVPKLKGETLKQAKNILGNANCDPGKIKGPKKGTVKKVKPKPGTELAPEADVNLTLKKKK